jgi:uncharacterized protein
MSMEKWYSEGIRFECTGCGKCCRCEEGEIGYVYLNGDDIRALSKCLGLPENEFRKKYTAPKDMYTIIAKPEEDCLFLRDNRCMVYSVRPLQCRTWPFWQTNMLRRDWEKKVLAVCPGIGIGGKYSTDEIERISRDEAEV